MTGPKVYGQMSDAALAPDREEETQIVIDRLTHELAARELNSRFLRALESGESEGDILIVDEHGEEVKASSPPITIFDVK